MTSFTMHSIVDPILEQDDSNMSWGDKSLLIGQLLWVTCVTLVRVSVLTLYVRIFPTPSFRKVCYLVLGFNLGYFMGVVLACFLICQPLAFIWDQSVNGSCGNQKSLDTFIGLFNLLLDVTAVALPMPVLWGLQMRKRRKLAVSGMFSMGAA